MRIFRRHVYRPSTGTIVLQGLAMAATIPPKGQRQYMKLYLMGYGYGDETIEETLNAFFPE